MKLLLSFVGIVLMLRWLVHEKSEGNTMKKDIEWLKSWFDDDKSGE